MRVIYIFFLSVIKLSVLYSQPTNDDGDFTSLELGIISCKDTLNFFQKKNNDIFSTDKEIKVDLFIIQDKIETNYNYRSGATAEEYLDTSNGSYYFVTDFESKNSDLKVIITRKKKRMIVFFRIKKHRDYLPWNIKMLMPFKKGTYQVTDPENPELIKVIDEK